MEDKAVSAVSLENENVGSSVLVETSPAPESLIQDTNVDLSSINCSQNPASELPAPTPDKPLTQPKGSRPTLASLAQLMHGKWRSGLEIGILTCTILVVWVLFSIPTILYALPPNIKELSLYLQPDTNLPSIMDQSASSCDQVIVYEGQICLNELTRWQQCFSPQSNAVYLPFGINQEEAETTARRLLQGLSLLSLSPECEAAIRPFLCLYLFGSCGSESQPHQVTQAECEILRENVCAQELVLAIRLLGEDVLPNCDDLLQQEEECQDGNSSTTFMEPYLNTTELTLETVNHSGIVCAEGYYLSNDSFGLCRPLCSFWVDPPGIGLDSQNIVVLVSVIIALVSSVTAIILAVTTQRKTMLTFPTIYLVFYCVTIAITAPLFFIGFIDRKKLFCTSDDLLESFQDETPFCIVQGIVVTYGQAQRGFWVAFHAIELCWGIVFPLHFRQMKTERKLKYFHITTVLLSLLLPILPPLINLHDGYTMADSPATVCFGRSVTVTFFALILPLSILIAVATSALIITFWKILKEFIMKSGKKVSLVGKAQAKILFIVCYYIVSGTLVLTVYSYYQVAGEASILAVTRHFACQSAGIQSGRDCGDVPEVYLEVFDSLLALSLILISLLPAMILVFMVKCNCNNRCCIKQNFKLSSTGITNVQ